MEEVKLAIKPYYQKKDITKEEYKDILRKAVHKVGPERQVHRWVEGVERPPYAGGENEGWYSLEGEGDNFIKPT